MDNLFLLPLRAGVNSKSFGIANGTTGQLFPLLSDQDLDGGRFDYHDPFRLIQTSSGHKVLPYIALNEDMQGFKDELIGDYKVTPFALKSHSQVQVN